MSGVSRLRGLVRSFVAWSLLLSPTLAAGAEPMLVQQIGELSSEVAEAVAAEVNVVPLSPAIDPRTTPIIVAPGKMFVRRAGGRVQGLSGPERRAIQQAYDAGQTILLLHASVHDIEALHALIKEGVTHRSSSDPAVLAYALRQESGMPTARIVHNLRPSLSAPGGIGGDFEDEGALQRALDVVISELIQSPVVAAAPTTSPPATDGDSPANWQQTPVQTAIITSTSYGIYNTPVDIYALHACEENKDYYLVDTGGDWTATEAQISSASVRQKEIQLNSDGSTLTVDWELGSSEWCGAGFPVANGDERICRYTPYPLWYEVDIVPPTGPTVVQADAKPSGDQGQSADYSSGFSFSITGEVDVSGDGPSAGIQPGVTWDNEVTTTVPPLVVAAGDLGNQGTFTRYQYCTLGTSPEDCTSNLQLINVGGLCDADVIGPPQQGQTPSGRLSDVAQTVYWQVDPATYDGSGTFDVTVTWQVNIATTQALFWNSYFRDIWSGRTGGPTTIGSCNLFGCSCAAPFTSSIDAHSLTFKVPIPSSNSCTSG